MDPRRHCLYSLSPKVGCTYVHKPSGYEGNTQKTRFYVCVYGLLKFVQVAGAWMVGNSSSSDEFIHTYIQQRS